MLTPIRGRRRVPGILPQVILERESVHPLPARAHADPLPPRRSGGDWTHLSQLLTCAAFVGMRGAAREEGREGRKRESRRGTNAKESVCLRLRVSVVARPCSTLYLSGSVFKP